MNNSIRPSFVIKTQLVESGIKMLNSGLTVGTWGNISIRDPHTGYVYLTPSAMDYDKIREDDIVVVSLDGALIEGDRKPTVESGLHLKIYQNRDDVNAVVHTHPIQSLVFSVLGREIPPITDEASQLIGSSVKVAKHAMPGSDELATNCVNTLGLSNACLLQSHGAVCVGEDISAAFNVCTVLEITAEVYRMALTIGDPITIPDKDIEAMRAFIKTKYGQNK